MNPFLDAPVWFAAAAGGLVCAAIGIVNAAVSISRNRRRFTAPFGGPLACGFAVTISFLLTLAVFSIEDIRLTTLLLACGIPAVVLVSLVGIVGMQED